MGPTGGFAISSSPGSLPASSLVCFIVAQASIDDNRAERERQILARCQHAGRTGRKSPFRPGTGQLLTIGLPGPSGALISVNRRSRVCSCRVPISKRPRCYVPTSPAQSPPMPIFSEANLTDARLVGWTSPAPCFSTPTSLARTSPTPSSAEDAEQPGSELRLVIRQSRHEVVVVRRRLLHRRPRPELLTWMCQGLLPMQLPRTILLLRLVAVRVLRLESWRAVVRRCGCGSESEAGEWAEPAAPTSPDCDRTRRNSFTAHLIQPIPRPWYRLSDPISRAHDRHAPGTNPGECVSAVRNSGAGQSLRSLK